MYVDVDIFFLNVEYTTKSISLIHESSTGAVKIMKTIKIKITNILKS